MNLIDKKYVKKKLKTLKRKDDAYKNQFGHVLIIAGSYGMAGAAAGCGLAALRSGAGLVTYAVQAEISNVLQVLVPEAMCINRYKGNIDLNKYDTIVFGPGLGINSQDEKLLKRILKEYKGKLLIDADGLNLISEKKLFKRVSSSSAQIVITPHIGEGIRLSYAIGQTDLSNVSRKNFAKLLSREYNCVCVLKGDGTLVCKKHSQEEIIAMRDKVNKKNEKAELLIEKMGDFSEESEIKESKIKKNSDLDILFGDGGIKKTEKKGEEKTKANADKKNNEEDTSTDIKEYKIMKNTTGNPGMATAGSGDVLSGVIAGLLSQGMDTFSAASVGVYLHGHAGDKAANKHGQRQIIARDIIEEL